MAGRGRPKGSKNRAPFTGRPIEWDVLTEQEMDFAQKLVNGRFENAFAAGRAAGIEESNLRTAVFNIQRRPAFHVYLRYLLSQSEVKPIEVLNTLAKQMRNSIEDFIDADGFLNLEVARQNGALAQVKKVSIDKETGQVTALELHSAQAAAIALSRCLGIEQQPRQNESDSERQRDFYLEKMRRFMARFNADAEETFKIWDTETDGDVSRYIKPQDLVEAANSLVN